jgi:hypothetical protein
MVNALFVACAWKKEATDIVTVRIYDGLKKEADPFSA